MRTEPSRTARRPAPFTVVIDAGHGGARDAGRSSAYGVRGPRGTLEKDVTLALAHRVAAHLGGRALLTRSGDVNRTIADRLGVARERDAQVFLSLHANGGSAQQRGAEAYVHARGSERSQALASSLQRELATLGGPQHDVGRHELAVLTPERLPATTAACLLEIDYLSSPDGEARLSDPRSLDKMARAIARGVDGYLGRHGRARRFGDGPPAVDPVTGQAPPPRPGEPGDIAAALLQGYLRPYMSRLGEEARQQLVRAWRESPGAVIAAGTLLGTAGVGWLAGTGTPLPQLPAIPLDVLGDVFRGAELKLKVNGPITAPDSFSFTVAFHERPAPRPEPSSGSAPSHPDIDSILGDVGTSSATIAARVNGPEFDTDVPDNTEHFNLGNNETFADFVYVIGGMLYDQVANEPARPWLDIVNYYNLPYIPTGFSRGMTRIIDALMAALPDRFGQLVQVSLAIRVAGETRWVPVIPTSARANYGRASAWALDEPNAPPPPPPPDLVVGDWQGPVDEGRASFGPFVIEQSESYYTWPKTSLQSTITWGKVNRGGPIEAHVDHFWITNDADTNGPAVVEEWVDADAIAAGATGQTHYILPANTLPAGTYTLHVEVNHGGNPNGAPPISAPLPEVTYANNSAEHGGMQFVAPPPPPSP